MSSGKREAATGRSHEVRKHLQDDDAGADVDGFVTDLVGVVQTCELRDRRDLDLLPSAQSMSAAEGTRLVCARRMRDT